MISLITGGAGFIGSHIVDSLLKYGDEVIVLDDLSGGFIENVNKEATFIKGSITDFELVDSIFKHHHIDYVYHCAAYAAEGLSHFIRRFNYTNNLLGSVNLINNAVRHECRNFIFLSSIAVYGTHVGTYSETTFPHPEDPYGIAKYAVELDLMAANKMFGLNYTIFRPHNVYGERQNLCDPYRNVVGIFMNKILQNQPCPIFGDGHQTRSFTYIHDIVPIIARLPRYPRFNNVILNIGADVSYPIIDLAYKIYEAMGEKNAPKLDFLPARNEVAHANSNHNKLKSLAAWKETPLENGLQWMSTWALATGVRVTEPFKEIEIEKGLPPSWKVK